MLKVEISKEAQKFLRSLAKKQEQQIVGKIGELRENSVPSDSKKLVGYPLYRVDSGEYRIIYYVIGNMLRIFVIGKRNDRDVYRKLKRKW